MPDTLNKQSLVNLLIDSPLREPIKINLIDIVNNTSDVDLPKVFPTIVKELEIFQKATERRMKLADETIAKLGGTSPTPTIPQVPETQAAPAQVTQPVPTAPVPPATPSPEPGLTVPPLDLPPLPSTPSVMPTDTMPVYTSSSTPVTEMSTSPLPTPMPLGGAAPMNPASDEAALAEIQKELDSLKSSTAAEITAAAAPAPANPPAPQA